MSDDTASDDAIDTDLLNDDSGRCDATWESALSRFRPKMAIYGCAADDSTMVNGESPLQYRNRSNWPLSCVGAFAPRTSVQLASYTK
jgi:hypothetical protein